jgi:hypothetical protein
MQETTSERIVLGVMAGIFAAVGALLWLVVDYLWWEMLPIQASSVGHFLQKTWFIPPAFGIATFAIGLWRGSEAFSFAKSIWEDIW